MAAGAGRAPVAALAAACLLSGQMGLYWDWDPRLPRTPTEAVTWTGYATFGLYNFLPVLNTFMKAWRMKSVGGGTRSEPFVASLLSSACWLCFSLMENGWKVDESVWLNGSGTVAYAVYLLMFLWYTDEAHRWITIEWWIPGAVLYLVATVAIRVLTEWTWLFKVMCTLAGLGSACASLVLTWFVLEREMEFLPDCVTTIVSLLHYCVWLTRDVIPATRDFYDFVQNFCGLGCSLAFLVLPFLPFFWTRDETQAKPTQEGQDDLHRLLTSPVRGAQPPPPPGGNVQNPTLLPTNMQIHARLPINLEAANVLQEPRRVLSAPPTPERQVDNTRRKSG